MTTRHHEVAARVERPDAIEHKDVNSRGIFIFLAWLFGSLIVVIVFLIWLFGVFAGMRGETPAARLRTTIPQPRIQAAPLVDIYNLRKREDSILNSYGWVAQPSGVARIPIDRAMDLLAQRGLPARTGADPGPTVPETGPESGGPQTGSPMPRFNRPPNMEPSTPPPLAPVPGIPEPRTAVPSGRVTEANR